MPLVRQFLAADDGATAVEYAVMLALIIVVAVVAIRSLGTNTSSLWGNNGSNLDIAWTAAGGS
jgi:pilus assembly protein Flp/PilA